MIKSLGNYIQPDQYRTEELSKKTEKIAKSLENKEIKDKELLKACQGFETIFYQMLFKEMRNTVHKTGLLSGGFAEDVFESMLDEQIAESASKADGTLANMLYQQLRMNLDTDE